MAKKKISIEPPSWMETDARAEWQRLVGEGLCTVTAGNRSTVAVYYQAFARWRQAETKLSTDGTELVVRGDGGEIKAVLPSPQVGIATKYLDRMLKAAALLGLSVREEPGADRAVRDEGFSDTAVEWFGRLQ